jgi:hypothetical protein
MEADDADCLFFVKLRYQAEIQVSALNPGNPEVIPRQEAFFVFASGLQRTKAMEILLPNVHGLILKSA